MKVSLNDLKPRDIIKYKDRNNEDYSYVAIVEYSTLGFYMYYCDEHGVPLSERIFHTNIIFTDDLEKVGELEESDLVEKTCLGYKYYESTAYDWINLQLCNLGPKYKIFSENASTREKNKYARNEDQNYHTENTLLVDKFIKSKL